MRSALFLALCLALPVAVAGEVKSAPELYTADAVGTIEVAADGRVVDVDITTELGGDVVAALERRIRTWRFASRDPGAPVARGRVDLNLRVLQTGDRASISMPEVRFSDLPGKRVDGPQIIVEHRGQRVAKAQYPQAELRLGIGARLTVILRIGADGVADEFTLERAEIHDSRKNQSHKRREEALARFAAAAEKATLQWRYPTIPVGDFVRIPMSFSPLGPYDSQGWKRTYDMTVLPEAWYGPDTRVSDLDAGGAPASHAFRLVTEKSAL